MVKHYKIEDRNIDINVMKPIWAFKELYPVLSKHYNEIKEQETPEDLEGWYNKLSPTEQSAIVDSIKASADGLQSFFNIGDDDKELDNPDLDAMYDGLDAAENFKFNKSDQQQPDPEKSPLGPNV